MVLRKTLKQRKILSYLRKHPSNQILFHHRWPSSVGVATNACHPFTTKNFFSKENGYSGKQYILIHNGTLRNRSDLQKEHKELGITYSSVQQDGDFNDSEALLWDLALVLEGKQKELHSAGSIAFICLEIDLEDFATKVYFGHNSGSPLSVDLQDDKLFISSEGEGEEAEENTLYIFDNFDKTMYERHLFMPSYYYSPNTKTTPEIKQNSYGQLDKRWFMDDEDDTELVKVGDQKLTYAGEYDGHYIYWDNELEDMVVLQDNGSFKPWNDVIGYDSSNDNMKMQAIKDLIKQKTNRLDGSKVNNDVAKITWYSDDSQSGAFKTAEGLWKKSSPLGMKFDIQTRLDHYLEYYKNDYIKAQSAIDKDIEWLQNEYAVILDHTTTGSENCMYEIKVMKGVSTVLTIINETISPVKQAVEKVANLKLLEAGTEDEDTPPSDSQIRDFRRVANKIMNSVVQPQEAIAT